MIRRLDAVDGTTGEVDQGSSTVEMTDPFPEVAPIPGGMTPGHTARRWSARENHHSASRVMQESRQVIAQKPGTARYDDPAGSGQAGHDNISWRACMQTRRDGSIWRGHAKTSSSIGCAVCGRAGVVEGWARSSGSSTLPAHCHRDLIDDAAIPAAVCPVCAALRLTVVPAHDLIQGHLLRHGHDAAGP